MRVRTAHIRRRGLPRVAAAALACLGLSALFNPAVAQPPAGGVPNVVSVVAAADLATCMDRLNQAFTLAEAGALVKASIASSGNAFAQIRNDAPFDVFLSADLDYPKKLAAAGAADASTLTVYANGRLALIGSAEVSGGMTSLTSPSVRRIAIANPDVAPYGRAAKAALQQVGLWERLQPKLVFGESVAQTAQFVTSGNADVGFVGAAHAAAAGHAWPVPPSLYPPIEQAGIVTAKGASNPLAGRYLRFLQSGEGRALLQQCGLVPPPSTSATASSAGNTAR